jgi:ABC-type glycerol-3-phosphate transport system substrate-binding protein
MDLHKRRERGGSYTALILGQTLAQCVIYNNEAFDQCKDLGVPLADIVADQTDYRAQAKAAKDAGDQEEVKRCVNLCLLKMIAITANKNLDQVYKAVFQ